MSEDGLDFRLEIGWIFRNLESEFDFSRSGCGARQSIADRLYPGGLRLKVSLEEVEDLIPGWERNPLFRDEIERFPEFRRGNVSSRLRSPDVDMSIDLRENWSHPGVIPGEPMVGSNLI